MGYVPARMPLSLLRKQLMPVCLSGVALFAAAAAAADVQQIKVQAVSGLADAVTLVDVRRPDEWQRTGLVPGSVPLTFFDRTGDYDVKAWLTALRSRIGSHDAPVVLICAAGVRSARIAELLDSRLGFTRVGNVTDGIDEWLKAGGKTTPWKP